MFKMKKFFECFCNSFLKINDDIVSYFNFFLLLCYFIVFFNVLLMIEL